MILHELKKIKGLTILELKNSSQFPIIELFLIFSSALLLASIFGGSSIYSLSIFYPFPSIKNTYITNVYNSLNYYLFINGLLLGLLYSNSFLNEKEQAFRQTILSYPVSKTMYFSVKLVFYFSLNLLMTLFLLIIDLSISPVSFDISILFLLMFVLVINQLFSTFVFLVIFLFLNNFLVSNFLLFGVWSFRFLFPGGSNNYLPNIIKPFLFPLYFLTEFLSNKITEIIIQLIIGIIITIVTFLVVLVSFRNKEIAKGV